MLNPNSELLIELTPEQAATIGGGFFKKAFRTQRRGLASAIKAAAPLARRLSPVIASPLARPVLTKGSSMMASPIGTVLNSES
jgi:hypothetical protein